MKRENVIFSIIFGLIAILSIFLIQPFISYIILAAVLTYTLFPVYSLIRKKTNQPRLSSVISITLVVVLLIIPSFLVAQRLAQEVTGAFSNFELSTVQRLGDYLSGLMGNRVDFQGIIDSFFNEVRESIFEIAPNVIGSIMELVLGLFIMFFVMYYAFRDGEHILLRIKQMLPLETSLKEKLFHEVRTVTQGVLYGQ
ncbi:uncharacterized protein METZ01_LOCUS444907, partial [marine metagenome]